MYNQRYNLPGNNALGIGVKLCATRSHTSCNAHLLSCEDLSTLPPYTPWSMGRLLHIHMGVMDNGIFLHLMDSNDNNHYSYKLIFNVMMWILQCTTTSHVPCLRLQCRQQWFKVSVEQWGLVTSSWEWCRDFFFTWFYMLSQTLFLIAMDQTLRPLIIAKNRNIMGFDLRPYLIRGLIATASGRNSKTTHNVRQAKQQSIAVLDRKPIIPIHTAPKGLLKEWLDQQICFLLCFTNCLNGRYTTQVMATFQFAAEPEMPWSARETASTRKHLMSASHSLKHFAWIEVVFCLNR